MKIWPILTYFDLKLTFPQVKLKNECHHRLLRPKWPTKHALHDIHATFSFGDLVWPDLDLDPYLVWDPYLQATFFISWEAFRKFGFTAVVSPVSGANQAKNDNLDLWPDLDKFS